MLAGTTQLVHLRVLYISAAIVLTLLVGLSRIYLGVHYPTDVIAGWSLGAAWALGYFILGDALVFPVDIGRGRYSIRNSASGAKHPKGGVAEFKVSPIIDQSQFDAVQQRLVDHNPRVTPPRVVTGPALLTGLATCEHCGGGMTMSTGTSKSGRVYTYYACANRAQKGTSVCKGNRIAMPHLDSIILEAEEDRILPPERIHVLLEN